MGVENPTCERVEKDGVENGAEARHRDDVYGGLLENRNHPFAVGAPLEIGPETGSRFGHRPDTQSLCELGSRAGPIDNHYRDFDPMINDCLEYRSGSTGKNGKTHRGNLPARGFMDSVLAIQSSQDSRIPKENPCP